MKKRSCILALLLLLTLPLLASAGESIVYEDAGYVAFSEPYGYSLIDIGPGCAATVGQHRYVFLKSVKEETRAAIIAKSEAALTALSDFCAEDRAYTIRIVKGSYAPRVDGSTLYIGTTAFNEVAISLGVALDDPVPLADALAAMSGDDRAYLDLNYACFSEPYADVVMQGHVQSVARAFAAWLTMEEKSSLLTDYSDAAFYGHLNAFLAANGQEAYENAGMWGISFHGGGDGSVRLRWETGSADYILSADYEDFSHGWPHYISPDPLNTSYIALRAELLQLEQQLLFVRETLGSYCSIPRPSVWFENDHAYYDTLPADAFWMQEENTMHVGSFRGVMHEYIHALSGTTAVNPWMDEVLAYYYQYIVCPAEINVNYPEAVLSFQRRDEPDYEAYDPTWAAFEARLSALLGHPVDYNNTDDALATFGAELYHSYTALPTRLMQVYRTDLSHFAAKVTFARYLVTQYGEDAMLRAAATDDPMTHLGGTWDDIIAQWVMYLDETYSALGN